MLFRKLFFIFTLLFFQFSYGSDCELWRDALKKNVPDRFWNEAATVDVKNPAAIERLRDKYGLGRKITSEGRKLTKSEGSSATIASAAQGSMYTMSKQAKKALKKLRGNPNIHRKFESFLEEAQEGFQKIYDAAKSRGWNLHAINDYGPGGHTVRLDKGFRVGFIRNKDNTIEIVNMGNEVSH